jgi:hypothetical protein
MIPGCVVPTPRPYSREDREDEEFVIGAYVGKGMRARADMAMMGFTSATRLPFVLVMGGSKTRSPLANPSHLKEFQGGAWAALHN